MWKIMNSNWEQNFEVLQYKNFYITWTPGEITFKWWYIRIQFLKPTSMLKENDVHTLIFHNIKCFVKITSTISLIFNFEFSRPDGQKKAYVRLAPDYDALDVASKIGII